MRKSHCFKPQTLPVIFLLISLCNSAIAQRDTLIFFFDREFKSVQKNKAEFIEVLVRRDAIWEAYVALRNGAKVMTGYYLDSLRTTGEGPFAYYYDNGKPESRGYYHNGKEEGWWVQWNDEGLLMDSSYFSGGVKVKQELFDYDVNGKPTGYHFAEASKNFRKNVSLYRDGSPRNILTWIDDDGVDSAFDEKTGELASITRWKDNKRTLVVKFNKDGSVKNQPKQNNDDAEMRLPHYPGGHAAFQEYLDVHLHIPGRVKQEIHFNDRVTFSFKLDEKGSPGDIKLIDIANPDLNDMIIRLLQSMPRWQMMGYKKWGPITWSIRLL